MMERPPLPEGRSLKIAGTLYHIDRLIGAGGYALIYAAHRNNSSAGFAIKEFFPCQNAHRLKSGRVSPLPGTNESFQHFLKRFTREADAGAAAAKASFQAVSFLTQERGYAVMQLWSDDICSLQALAALWRQTPPQPFSGRGAADADPVFSDLPRLHYALRVCKSLLSVVGALHQAGFLHLDISASNALWAGQDLATTGQTCAAFLADFGCAIPQAADGQWYAEVLPSRTLGFTAPEVLCPGTELTPAADLYSVAMLLFYLCAGAEAVPHYPELLSDLSSVFRWGLSGFRIPRAMRSTLQDILCGCTARDPAERRYQSAEALKSALQELENQIRLRPITPRDSTAFTLYTLKALLTETSDSAPGWASELADRLDRDRPVQAAAQHLPLTSQTFQSDEAFAKAILPSILYHDLQQLLRDSPFTWQDILSGTYDPFWKAQLCQKLRCGLCRDLLCIGRNLQINQTCYLSALAQLTSLLQDRFLLHCLQRCGAYNKPYIGIALLIAYALLGPETFREQLVESEQNVSQYFHQL